VLKTSQKTGKPGPAEKKRKMRRKTLATLRKQVLLKKSVADFLKRV
jgi:hypothetical protein